MSTITETLPAFLRAPRVPKTCPVNITKVSTINDSSGNGRRLWIVRDGTGDVVEVHVGDESTESRVMARWPYFHSTNMRRFDVGEHQRAHPLNIDVTPGEFKRLSKLEPWSERATKLRAVGDRFERYSAVADAISDVRRDGGGEHRLDGPRTAIIYQRTPKCGGDHVSVAVRRALALAVKAGVVELVPHDHSNNDAKTRAWLEGTYKRYRATDTTPYI